MILLPLESILDKFWYCIRIHLRVQTQQQNFRDLIKYSIKKEKQQQSHIDLYDHYVMRCEIWVPPLFHI